MSEQRQEFENALENIESKVIELFAMVGEDLPSATRALLNCDGEALTALIERDREIDALYREVEELVNRAITSLLAYQATIAPSPGPMTCA